MSLQSEFDLLTNWTTNAAGPTVRWPGGDGFIGIKGTWGGATVVLQYSPTEAGDWYDLDDTESFTESKSSIFSLPKGFIRAVASSGTSASISAYVRPL